MFDLIAVDKSWVDILLSVPALPGRDQKVLARPLGRHPGGTGANVACTASRLGLRTGLVSWVGDDADGQLILADLRHFGVDTTYVTTTPNASSNYTTVLIDPSGEKAIVIVPTTFDVLDLTPALTATLRQARLVYIPPYDLEQLEQVAQIVRPAGGRICTDIEPVAGLQEKTLPHVLSLVDLAFFNSATLPPDNLAETAMTLAAGGPERVIITCGAGGALACDGREVFTAPAYEVPVKDTTGAGDCFTGAFLAATIHHFPLAEALQYANAAAALSLQAYGPRGTLPTDDEVRGFIERYGRTT